LEKEHDIEMKRNLDQAEEEEVKDEQNEHNFPKPANLEIN
jgi:hypothetical protein